MNRHHALFHSKRVREGRSGAALALSPRALGWKSIAFAIRKLAGGAVWSGRLGREERCLVLLSGEFDVRWSTETHRVGPRADVFAAYPSAVYLAPGTSFKIVATRACEIADSRVAATARQESRVIRPADCGFEVRGGGNATRQIVDIMPPGFPANRLMVCEVYTPGGNWSSYPPHKHDTDDLPREADLDEVYYYRFRDNAGYGLQRLYSDRGDDTMRVVDGDVVAVRNGYHPFVAAYGYDAYYLNVLAGNRRSMAASDDPAHARFRRRWPPPDPRMPMVAPPAAVEHMLSKRS